MPLRADDPGAAALKVYVTRACSSDTSIVSVGAIKKYCPEFSVSRITREEASLRSAWIVHAAVQVSA